MKVEIWSDIMCPFCYIGKRRFEAALDAFAGKEDVEVVWHSFQLNPNLQYKEGQDVYDYLAESKGQSREWSVMMHEHVVDMARSVGLDYRFDKAKVANSFDAHRVIQLAKKYNKANEIEERFFRAYFTEGEIMSDHETLVRLAVDTGIPADEVRKALETGAYADEVRADVAEAEQLRIQGVPFFVIDRKYGVSGAQDISVFAQALEKAVAE